MTANEVWDLLHAAVRMAGPWESGQSGEMDVRRSSDGSIIATTLWVIPEHPKGSWRVPVATSDREGADLILREHGWLLTGAS
jgi:hypothetical protein